MANQLPREAHKQGVEVVALCMHLASDHLKQTVCSFPNEYKKGLCWIKPRLHLVQFLVSHNGRPHKQEVKAIVVEIMAVSTLDTVSFYFPRWVFYPKNKETSHCGSEHTTGAWPNLGWRGWGEE